MAVSCYQSQNYKIWKQFTTRGFPLYIHIVLLSISKLQNLKAIHNRLQVLQCGWIVVINHKTTKFESNSQQKGQSYYDSPCCYQSQNYKIWKQFTTGVVSALWCSGLLSITKLQNLKVIHNCRVSRLYAKCVVINHKIWKQFTTGSTSINLLSGLLSIIKLQNLKAIHNSTFMQL